MFFFVSSLSRIDVLLTGARDLLPRGLLMAAVVWVVGCGPPQLPPAPEQPIAFSHRAHAQAEVPCSQCHRGAYEGKRAGLAPLQACALCHRREIPDHPEVAKVLAAWQERQTIAWRRVYWLPETSMVQFNHRAHVRAEIECQTCHGPVEEMTVVEPVVNIADMGWCLECHRQRGANDDCLACHY